MNAAIFLTTPRITVFAIIRNNCDLIPRQAGNGLIFKSEIDDERGFAAYRNNSLHGKGEALAITGSINEKYQGVR